MANHVLDQIRNRFAVPSLVLTGIANGIWGPLVHPTARVHALHLTLPLPLPPKVVLAVRRLSVAPESLVRFPAVFDTCYKLTCTTDDVSTSYAKAVLYEFLDNPECPIPQSADDDEDDMSVVGTQNIGLAKRDSLGSFPNSDGVHAWTAAIMGVSAAATVIRRAWDASIGSDTLNSWEIFKLIASRPDEDPASVIGQSLCDFTHARHDFKELDETATEMCVPAWSSNHTSSNDLEKRVFRADLRTTQPTSSTGGSRINTGALLHRILETDDVPFLYSRVARYRHRERLAPVGNQRVGSFMVDENGEPIVTEQVNLEGICLAETSTSSTLR